MARRPSRSQAAPVQGGGRLAALLRDRDGNVTIEAAVVLPVLVLFLLGTIETGRMLWLQNALHYAVESAARCSAVNTTVCGSPTQTKSFAATTSGFAFSTTVFAVATAACGSLVSASYPFTFVVPLLGASVTLQAQSCYPT
jgi:Flp pilus assembly protein TadG